MTRTRSNPLITASQSLTHTYTQTRKHTHIRMNAPFGTDGAAVYLPASSSPFQGSVQVRVQASRSSAQLPGANEGRTLVLTTFIIYGIFSSVLDRKPWMPEW